MLPWNARGELLVSLAMHASPAGRVDWSALAHYVISSLFMYLSNFSCVERGHSLELWVWLKTM